MATALKVGIIGGGQVGATLGTRLALKGHKITYGSRDPAAAKVQELVKSQPGASADTLTGTVDWADAVLITVAAIPDVAVLKNIASSLGPGVAGKVVIDVVNPVSAFPGLALDWDESKSAGEIFQESLPDAAVFKAFNTVGVSVMADPIIDGKPTTMLYAGDGTDEQLATAEKIVADVGFVPEYVGPIRYARNLEAIAELWIHLAVPPAHVGRPVNWGGHFNFHVIGKQA